VMYGREKSDSAIVALKPANNAGQPAAEWVERRAEAEGNTVELTHAPDAEPGKCVPGAGPCAARRTSCVAVIHPRWEPGA
jgi:hypothetical protein